MAKRLSEWIFITDLSAVMPIRTIPQKYADAARDIKMNTYHIGAQ